MVVLSSFFHFVSAPPPPLLVSDSTTHPAAVNVLTLEDGQLGIFTRFENCSFSDNSAVEVGGALGAAFYILSRAAQSINPLEIVDW